MNDHNLTKWQRGTLLTMLLVSQRYDNPYGVWFSRRSLEYMLWFSWHPHHTKKMAILISAKWIEARKDARGIYLYRLTPEARSCIHSDVKSGLEYATILEQQDTLL